MLRTSGEESVLSIQMSLSLAFWVDLLRLGTGDGSGGVQFAISVPLCKVTELEV